MPNYSIRLTRPYSELAEWISGLQGSHTIAYEHPADEEVSRTHVHMILIGSPINKEALKAQLRKLGEWEKTDWVITDYYSILKVKYPVTLETINRGITYMSKGEYDPSYVSGIPETDIARFRSAWVAGSARSEKDKTPKINQYKLALELHQTLHKPRTQIEDYVDHMNNELHDYEEYCSEAIKLHHKHGVSFSFFSIDKVIHTAYTMRSEHRTTFVRKLTERYYK